MELKDEDEVVPLENFGREGETYLKVSDHFSRSTVVLPRTHLALLSRSTFYYYTTTPSLRILGLSRQPTKLSRVLSVTSGGKLSPLTLSFSNLISRGTSSPHLE
jgi:hypothetical protein